MAKPWAVATGGASAWATQVEEEEEANGGQLAPLAPVGGEEAFPTLGEAVQAAKTEGKGKKKKQQKLSLAEFTAYKAPAGRHAATDDDILARLPTKPREREAGDDSRGLGGAFKDYGGRDRGRGESRGGFGDRGRSRDGSEEGREDLGPSRADEDNDWGASKKFVSSDAPRRGGGFGGGGFADRGSDREGGGSFRDRDSLEPSRADTADKWSKDSKFASHEAGYQERPTRGGFGFSRGGFEDRERDQEPLGPSKADEEDRWSKKFVPSEPAPAGGGGGGFGDRPSERFEDRERWGGGGGGGGGMRGRREDAPLPRDAPPATGRPRLQLKPRSLPPPDVAKGPAPAEPSARTSKSNPFGAARPREEVLQEQGRDWKKEELVLEHRGVDRDETAEEADLRRQVEALKVRVEAGEGDAPAYTEEEAAPEAEEAAGASGEAAEGAEPAADAAKKKGPTVHEEFQSLEMRLLKLSAELDDAVV